MEVLAGVVLRQSQGMRFARLLSLTEILISEAAEVVVSLAEWSDETVKVFYCFRRRPVVSLPVVAFEMPFALLVSDDLRIPFVRALPLGMFVSEPDRSRMYESS